MIYPGSLPGASPVLSTSLRFSTIFTCLQFLQFQTDTNRKPISNTIIPGLETEKPANQLQKKVTQVYNKTICIWALDFVLKVTKEKLKLSSNI